MPETPKSPPACPSCDRLRRKVGRAEAQLHDLAGKLAREKQETARLYQLLHARERHETEREGEP